MTRRPQAQELTGHAQSTASEIQSADDPRPAGARDAERERAAISRSVTDLIPALRGFARSITRDVVEADDLVQETLVRAIANLHQFMPGTNLKAWLFTILRNTHISLSKRRGRERSMTSSLDASDVGVAPAQPWMTASTDFRNALERLPEDQREVLVLIGALGVSYEECAEICDCPIGTIKSRLNRGRARLAELLDAASADEL